MRSHNACHKMRTGQTLFFPLRLEIRLLFSFNMTLCTHRRQEITLQCQTINYTSLRYIFETGHIRIFFLVLMWSIFVYSSPKYMYIFINTHVYIIQNKES